MALSTFAEKPLIGENPVNAVFRQAAHTLMLVLLWHTVNAEKFSILI
jgi:hypothetical protein